MTARALALFALMAGLVVGGIIVAVLEAAALMALLLGDYEAFDEIEDI